MKLRPLQASEFLEFDAIMQELIKKSGGLPINDKLLPVWSQDADIILPHGGRGGGKSETTADRLLDDCMNDEYFKCYYGRKVFDTVRGSSFDTLISSIRKNNIENEFSYSDAPTSSMIILHKSTKNKFIPFGSDKADKLKSIKDPTHLWCEEFDQFTSNDFKELFPVLRTVRGRKLFIGTFNTYSIKPEHWIKKVFFPELSDGKSIEEDTLIELLSDLKVVKIFINFMDNYFIDQEQYSKRLMLAALGNFTTYKGLANGDWGINENDTPYAYAFSRAKHVSNGTTIPHPIPTRFEELILCWDFNRNPMTCDIIQHYDQKVRVLEVIRIPNSGVDAMCEQILVKYPGFLYVVTGDYNGDNASSLYAELVTHYLLIKKYLRLTQGQIKIRPNPRQAKNSTHINTILSYYDVIIHGINAKELVFDLENVKRRADGTILKTDRDQPDQQADALDCFIGETLIITSIGEKRIDSIELNEKVLTRKGYKRVIDKWSSIAEVYEFELSNGIKITCTKDHRFYNISKGFIPIFDIFEDNLKVCQYKAGKSLNTKQKNKGLSIMAGAISSIPTKIISILPIRKTTADAFTERNGLMPTGQYQKDSMFITKIITRLITIYQILSLKIKAHTNVNTQEKGLKKILSSTLRCKRKVLQLLRNGIDQRQVLNGTGKMQLIAVLDIKHAELKNASNAQKNLKQRIVIRDFAATIVNQHGGEKIIRIRKQQYARLVGRDMKHLNICQENSAQEHVHPHQTHMEIWVRKVTYKGQQLVYDITVEDEHEFYANRILVHNCFRYFCNEFLEKFQPTEEQIMAKYSESGIKLQKGLMTIN